MLDRLLRVDDPRDNLEKARLGELEKFARANNVEFKQGLPAMVLRKILRSKGLVTIAIPPRVLGQYQPNPGEAITSAPITSGQGIETDAAADLAKQHAAQEKPVDQMTITELRQACKKRGIKMARTDNMAALRTKLEG